VGVPADSPQPSAVAPEPVAERRVCSVLFCDLVGFTSRSEADDPEAVRELLTRYFETARTVIGRYGGVVEKFIGDAVMAVWGTPVATEEDAERAVRAGLDLVEAVQTLGVERGTDDLRARAGVVTGEVAVTIGATNEGMVAGDAVNTAARIQATATPGSVFVDATTRRLTTNAISFDDAGEHHLKGKAEPERCWRATHVVSAIGGAQRVDGLEAPLIGRGAEMRMIRELFHASAERRQPRLVLVSGPAGAGKSRLGWEFEKYIDGLADTVWWHRGRCLSYGEGLVFWALAQAVRRRLEIAEEDEPEVVAVKLADGVERFVSDPDDRVFIGVRLGRLLGVRFAGDPGNELTREELFAGWRQFFEQLAATAPVAILIEDAHHARGELLEFVDHLVDWVRDLPLFVLVFARPGIDERRPGFGSGRNRVSITLDPLDAPSMDALVEALIPGSPSSARAMIVERAQGIPLYAVESIRALIDRDVVRPVEGVYRLVGDVGQLEVPDSLHALLAARLDALDPQVRHVLNGAAVLGSSFPAEAVTGVSGLPSDTVDSILAELLRREVLQVSADPRSPERGNYRFAQEMLRQVAYETLSRRDRKARHLTVAAHLRATFPRDGEEVIDVVARHYLDALEAVPDDGDVAEIRELAVAAMTRAADRATRAGASDRATSSYLEAAELLERADAHDPRVADLLVRAAQPTMFERPTVAAVRVAERAVEAHMARDDDRALARARIVLGRLLRRLGRHTDARLQLTAAVEVLRENPDIDTSHAIEQLASLESFAGTPAANLLTDEALRVVAELDLPARLPEVLITRAIYLDTAGRRLESVMFFREAARLADEHENAPLAAVSYLNLANVLNVDDPVGAAEAARRGLDLSIRSGDRFGLGVSVTNIVLALAATGDWDGAEQVLDDDPNRHLFADDEYFIVVHAWFSALRGDTDVAEELLGRLEMLPASEDAQDTAVVAIVRAAVATAHNDHEEALHQSRIAAEQLERALPFACDTGRWAWPLAARSAHQLGDLAAEAELLELCERQPRGHVAPMQRAEAVLIRARLAAGEHTGHTGDAAEKFVVAVDALHSSSTPYHLAHGLLDHAEFLTTSGDSAAIERAIAEARSIATSLGCRPLLERADRLAAPADHGAAITQH
jgi:class 3 adenylate cyclase/tetratricopeptide (TPR) repeat protein